jgi:uncharacterized protein (DUF1330 family)
MNAYAVPRERERRRDIRDIRKEVIATLQHMAGASWCGGVFSVVEGEWPLPRLVIIEFPSRAAVEDWYVSPEYLKLLPLRLKSTVGNAVIADDAE